MVSTPSFDPDAFARGLTADEWQALRDDAASAAEQQGDRRRYPPGSTFKMVTALAALEAGDRARATRSSAPASSQLGSVRFHCWKQGGPRPLDMRRRHRAVLRRATSTRWRGASASIAIAEMARALRPRPARRARPAGREGRPHSRPRPGRRRPSASPGSPARRSSRHRPGLHRGRRRCSSPS